VIALLFEPSVNLAVLLGVIGAVLLVACGRNLADTPVIYRDPGDRAPQAVLLAGLLLGLLLLGGGFYVGYTAVQDVQFQADQWQSAQGPGCVSGG
jgi:hypothetical protein